jgi:tetratricopeptide (TPR) repeat protein
MNSPLLVEFFSALPNDALGGDLDWPISQYTREKAPHAAETRTTGKARRRAAIHIFCKQVRQRYTEGTLLRVLHVGNITARRAAIFALGLLGSPAVNAVLADRLHDEDDEVARFASEAMWSLWFRGESSPHSDELYRILRLRDCKQAIASLDDLVERAPDFPEAFNQRAILYFQFEQFALSARDCTTALKLNPHHFGAQAGLGQCLLRLRRPRAALRSFRLALRINPRLEGISGTVKALEIALEDEGC